LDAHWPKALREITGRDVPFGAAFAWNPSAKGVKSEDTFLLLPDGSREIITQTPSLPEVDLEALLHRPTESIKSGIA
jgi:antitoxin VapB